jgi:hypothetical protein
MMCISPFIRQNKDTSIDRFPCGRCIACRHNRVMEWANRMEHESEEWIHTSFVTLTFDNENLNAGFNIDKVDLQLFFKRLRKELRKSYRGFKYYACGEYGEEFGRPHYHFIGFGLGMDDLELIKEKWGKGSVDMVPATYGRYKYVAKYVMKSVLGDGSEDAYGDFPPFAIMSYGIGEMYTVKNGDLLSDRMVLKKEGKDIPLPRYYKKKLVESGMLTSVAFKDKMNDVQLDRIAEMRAKGLTLVEISKELGREAKQKAINKAARESQSKRKL